jgi:hypothetical protein
LAQICSCPLTGHPDLYVFLPGWVLFCIHRWHFSAISCRCLSHSFLCIRFSFVDLCRMGNQVDAFPFNAETKIRQSFSNLIDSFKAIVAQRAPEEESEFFAPSNRLSGSVSC